jgi:hypothetical protein
MVDMGMSNAPAVDHLRVLVANQRPQRLDYVTTIVASLGHEVIARSIEVEDVAELTARERPDVALVGLGDSSKHALDLIDRIVRAAAWPVIAILETDDRDFVNEAAKRGIFAYIADGDAEQLAKLAGHRTSPFRRVPEPGGRIRAARADRACQGYPDGTPRRRRRGRIRTASHSLPEQQPKADRYRQRRRRWPRAAPRPTQTPRFEGFEAHYRGSVATRSRSDPRRGG